MHLQLSALYLLVYLFTELIVYSQVIPNSQITALDTMIELAVGDGWIDRIDDYPFSYRFGIRTLLVNNKYRDYWMPTTTSDYVSIVLASGIIHYRTKLDFIVISAWPPPHAVCGDRIGYQAMVEVCDRLSACSSTLSSTFIVDHPMNSSLAISTLLSIISSDIANGTYHVTII